MLSGRVDATLGAYWNYEAIQLRQEQRRANVIHVENAGVPDYDELVLVARENTIAKRTNVLRRFVQALGRGYEAVRQDPQAGVAALVRANPSLQSRAPAGERARHAVLVLPRHRRRAVGLAGPAAVDRLRRVDAQPPPDHQPRAVAGASTNQLLAGQGPSS